MDKLSYHNRLEVVRGRFGSPSIRHFHGVLVSELGYEGSYPSVRAYHRGEREPPVEYFRFVAELTGARLAWLLTGEEPMFKDSQGPLLDLLDHRSPGWRELLVRNAERASEAELAFWKAFPDVWSYPKPVTSLLGELLARCQAAARPAGELEAVDLEKLGRDVRALLEFPYEKLGFSAHASSREFTDFAVTLLSGLLQTVPAEGSGGLG